MLGLFRDTRRRVRRRRSTPDDRRRRRRARALLTTQASTKVYRSLRPGEPASRPTVDDDGRCSPCCPIRLSAFRGADFSQTQRYDLRRDASLVVVDWMTSGRHARRRTVGVHALRQPPRYQRDGQPRLLRRPRADSTTGDSIADGWGGFDVCLTAVVTGPLVSADAAAHAGGCVATRSVAQDADLVEVRLSTR